MTKSPGQRPSRRRWRTVAPLLSIGALVAVIVVIGLVATSRAAWPGANGRIVFSRTTRSMLYTVAPDGSGLRRLGVGFAGSWSADGRKVVFVAIRPSGPPGGYRSVLATMNADGTHVRTIALKTVPRDYDGPKAPALSPDGQRIAFVRKPRGAQAVYVARSDGTHQRRLTPAYPKRNYNSPTWSPDGRHIALIGNGQLAVIRSDGSNLRAITAVSFPDQYLNLDWSPDGTHLAATRGGNLYVLGADGGNETLIATGSHIFYPAWSPDGRQIAFSTGPGDAGPNTIEVVNADGTGRHVIRTEPVFDTDLHWQPMSPSAARRKPLREEFGEDPQ